MRVLVLTLLNYHSKITPHNTVVLYVVRGEPKQPDTLPAAVT